ncbi:MAG: flagellar hook-length control protein FliK [Deltaproteobacteria bacterium]|nr:flagellar hook-length control protein FliK [Deltaproteobacteria bacterium]
MAPLTPNTLSTLLNTIRLDSTAAATPTGNVPTINVGDIIKLIVRQNQGNGQGMLFYNGQLIPAQLPEFLLSGDKLTARVLFENDQLIFKILDLSRPQLLERQAIFQNLEQQVKKFVIQTLYSFLDTATNKNIDLKEILSSPTMPAEVKTFLREQIAPLLNELLEHISSNQLSEKLMSANSPINAQQIKQVVQEFKKVIAEFTPTNTHKTIEILSQQLAKFLEQNLPPEQAAKTLLQLIDTARKDLTEQTPTKTKDIAVRARLLEQFAAFEQNPAQQSATTQQILTALNSYLSSARTIDPKTLAELTQLTSRLETLAGAQETLAQLNPVMQALGDPAMILFPFIFHGLFAQAQISLPPEDRVKKKGKGEEEEASSSKEPMQRVQISIPLPHLGIVDIDVAHSKSEIMVRFTVENQEIADFLLEQEEKLVLVLKDKGFKQTELLTQVRPEQISTGVRLNVFSKTSYVA